MNARLVLCCVVLGLCACNSSTPLPTAQVEEFVRNYVAATNNADAAKIMSLVLHETAASSIAGGKIDRGWDAIKVSLDANLAKRKGNVTIETIDITPLSAESAVAVGTLNVAGVRQIGNLIVDNVPGAFTMVVKKTPDGLRLVHEHYSVRLK